MNRQKDKLKDPLESLTYLKEEIDMEDDLSHIMHHLINGHVTSCLTFEYDGTYIHEISLIGLQKLWKLSNRKRGKHYYIRNRVHPAFSRNIVILHNS